ncbi:uncharacterized protein SEPMUDRAFT_159023 [Sphaerulina musiva SO2202]|uniref:Uncharacterized protein n=1 Tax=Sphaerulina musiva (strain SO2202) TaxID=692275 RepID=M3BS75_SPHMS|nr:uncharacterized protein SEPMUDRAFT_159023 [Sphaerulina musiva SO2202]EMF08933.1 hypothetical protein SEPMUDRAFT_159023 [Sphaerulina musiva SO2202]
MCQLGIIASQASHMNRPAGRVTTTKWGDVCAFTLRTLGARGGIDGPNSNQRMVVRSGGGGRSQARWCGAFRPCLHAAVLSSLSHEVEAKTSLLHLLVSMPARCATHSWISMVPCYGACAAPDLALSRTCKVSTALQKTFASRCMDFLQEPVWGIIDGTGAGKVTFQMSRDDEPGLVWSGRLAGSVRSIPTLDSRRVASCVTRGPAESQDDLPPGFRFLPPLSGIYTVSLSGMNAQAAFRGVWQMAWYTYAVIMSGSRVVCWWRTTDERCGGGDDE